MTINAVLTSAWLRPVLHLLCLLPFCALTWAAFNDGLGANPVEKLTFETGLWTLRLLLVTLALTPLRQWTGLAAVIRYRRMVGLYSFFYLCCHFLIWFVADHSLSLSSMIEDIVKRPYITLGFSAFVLMIPLAITSNRAMLLRLGKKWKALHQLVYPILLLAVLHFVWLTKADYLEPGIYAIIAVILLLHRVVPIRRFFVRFSPVTR
ncbi:MAG: protein-methionine-sulfoxide reductase heme-binding subunit MsrQ [Gammaproteobacteria bacterium]|jgi:sulfoxide reductase heme-binding subunit YedZ